MIGKRRPRSTRFAWATVAAVALSLGAMAATGAAKDRNGDGLPDRWERHNDLSLQVDQARRDQDGDQLRNRGEYRAGMDPRDADTDGDGIPDGEEGAGTITAWDPDTGELTINTFGGESVTGTVTDETQIECRNDDGTQPDDPADEVSKHPSGDPTTPSGSDPVAPSGAPAQQGGPDHAGEHDCDGSNCSVDDLAVDGAVSEASLKLTSDGLVFVEIQLG
ncbi:MAG: hypothetical protein QOI10_2640 [Solirubrobacterales bacterium]|nr:hypothetical protein [Solirubrobacterales bacterium]